VAAAVRKETAVFIPAAADTRLLFEDQPLRRVNVAGTQNALELARSCARLRQFVQVSTHCVAGRQTGMVREELTRRPPEFLNSYERTKWEAEQLVAAAPFPVQLVRLTSCIGHESTGRCHRVGAIHHLLDWMLRGLLPMIPGTPQTPVDLISHDLAARMLVKAGLSRREGFNVYQVAAGKDAPPLAELLDFLTTCFRDQHPAWRRGQIAPPVIVDAATFQDFRETIVRSRDLLFGQILQAVDAFLPALLYPRSYATTRAEQLWQGPLPKADWRSLIGKVVESRLSSTARAAASVSRNHG
jgi:nucleoside-diphosphate-sugar epimerase